MALTVWNSTPARVRVLCYTAMTICVIVQTMILGFATRQPATDGKSPLLIASSASVITSCCLQFLLICLYPPQLLLTLCLFEIPVIVALLSAVLSFTAQVTSAFALSFTSSTLAIFFTVLSWVSSV